MSPTVAAAAGLILAMTLAGSAAASNCRPLEMRMMQLQGGGGRSAEMAQVHNLLVQRGCRSGRIRNVSVEPQRRAKRDKSARQVARAEPAKRRPAERRTRREAAPRVADGTFRTLCVRSCDGYYFPISFSTTRDRFASDQATCEQMCPASQVSLFYHSTDNGGPEDMVSVEGAPYSGLPTAFRYRTVLDESCSCGAVPPAGGTIAATAVTEPPAVLPVARLPLPRPALGADPETLANRAGHFVPAPVEAELEVATAPMPGGPARIVGDTGTTLLLLTEVPN